MVRDGPYRLSRCIRVISFPFYYRPCCESHTMEHSTEIILTIAGIVLVHGLIFYFLTRKSRLIKGKHVVVTGGSSGIGLWAAIECVRLGAHVTIIARNVSLLGKEEKQYCRRSE